MQVLLLIALGLICNACGAGGSSHHRTSYVISQAHEAAAEVEVVNELPSE